MYHQTQGFLEQVSFKLTNESQGQTWARNRFCQSVADFEKPPFLPLRMTASPVA